MFEILMKLVFMHHSYFSAYIITNYKKLCIKFQTFLPNENNFIEI